jgi:hypothetical protein
MLIVSMFVAFIGHESTELRITKDVDGNSVGLAFKKLSERHPLTGVKLVEGRNNVLVSNTA